MLYLGSAFTSILCSFFSSIFLCLLLRLCRDFPIITFYLHHIFAISEKVSFPLKFISNHLSLLKNVAVQVPTSLLHELFLWYGWKTKGVLSYFHPEPLSEISGGPRAGFELAQNWSSGLVEWSRGLLISILYCALIAPLKELPG